MRAEGIHPSPSSSPPTSVHLPLCSFLSCIPHKDSIEEQGCVVDV